MTNSQLTCNGKQFQNFMWWHFGKNIFLLNRFILIFSTPWWSPPPCRYEKPVTMCVVLWLGWNTPEVLKDCWSECKILYIPVLVWFSDKGIDGISHWEAINKGTEGQRTEFIYNLDDVVPATQGHAGIR